MDVLSYKTLEDLGYTGYINKSGAEKVLQIGDGNFLRAFADYFLDVCSEDGSFDGKVAVVQPKSKGKSSIYDTHNSLYTLYTMGIVDGAAVRSSRIISSLSRCLDFYNHMEEIQSICMSRNLEYIISNTTEAGIVYDSSCSFRDAVPASFPAKLTKLLYWRYKAGEAGVIILCCELIDNNADVLKDYVIKHARDWNLGENFISWLENDNMFCNTLVDRIVPGAIKNPEEIARNEEENHYKDCLAVAAEHFSFWAIEGTEELAARMPFVRDDLNVKVVPDIKPYKIRKVRILNGSHTGMALGAYLAGYDIVRDAVKDPVISRFLEKMTKEEIIPYIDLDKDELVKFADSVRDRFLNPFIDHQLMSISMNSVSKWKARNLPSLLDYCAFGKCSEALETGKLDTGDCKSSRLPRCLTAGLAFLIDFYWMHIKAREGKAFVCMRKQETYNVSDDTSVLDFFYKHRNCSIEEIVEKTLENEEFWGMNLCIVEGLKEQVTADLTLVKAEGEMALFEDCLR